MNKSVNQKFFSALAAAEAEVLQFWAIVHTERC